MSQTATPSVTADDDRYEIRPFEPADREGYMTLYDQILSGGDDDWFAWKYETNPFADEVPIVVATDGDRVVGAKSAVAIRLRAGDRTVDALQPADTMVHPDHRRRGLFSRMTEFMKDRYAGRSPQLFFNFPNERTLAGGLKHGWREVGRVPTYYRIQSGRAMVGDGLPGPVERGLGLLDPALGAYQRLRGAFVSTPIDLTVEERDGVQADVMSDLYHRQIPAEIHAERSEQFYDWRFDNPKWTYRTYLAGRAGPEVGIVTGTGDVDGQRTVNLVDVAPLVGDERRPALKAALEAVCARNADADLLVVNGRAIPDDLLSSFGFLPDTSLPLSAVSTPSAFVSYPLTEDGSWTIGGRDVRQERNWMVTFAERDTR